MVLSSFVLAHVQADIWKEIKKSGTYSFGSVVAKSSTEDGSSGALIIRGDNLVVDLKGSVLRGTPTTTEPDQRKGTGIKVIGKNVTIRNAHVHGYKIGLFAKDAPGLKIENSDFSYNWKQHLGSTIEKEDSADWMSYHQNEKDEWLRYGAGIYLRGCDRAVLQNVTIEGGNCGLMLTSSNNVEVTGCKFNFLSAIGLGMYRSSRAKIVGNNIDWCVRGYSHGLWNRGQDSAGILIYEQSNDNLFAYNSVTHGGDGFFLWAGQTTMDTGKGGCNGNLLYGNDFSHAPTNGIEATFSYNSFIGNLILECWHGIWGGYSYDTQVIGNSFGLNAQAIAWEHGQKNTFKDNKFFRDTEAVNIWQNDSQDPNWVYPKTKDTSSSENVFTGNSFEYTADSVFNFGKTKNVTISENTFTGVKEIVKNPEKVTNLVFTKNTLFSDRLIDKFRGADYMKSGFRPSSVVARYMAPPALMHPSGNVILGLDPDLSSYLQRFNRNWNPVTLSQTKLIKDLDLMLPAPPKKLPFIPKGELRGRRYILVDEWGPYDFKRPILWPRSSVVKDGRRIMEFEVIMPSGKFEIKSTKGMDKVTSVNINDRMAKVVAVVTPGAQELEINAVYVGQETVDYKGNITPKGRSVPFGWSKTMMPILWKVGQFNYVPVEEDPRTAIDKYKAHYDKFDYTFETDELNGSWSGSPGKGINANNFGTVAVGTVTLPAGTYSLEVTSDDGVRVWVDGKQVIDHWTYHAPEQDKVQLKLGGKHEIRVEHFDLDGYSALKVDLKKVR